MCINFDTHCIHQIYATCIINKIINCVKLYFRNYPILIRVITFGKMLSVDQFLKICVNHEAYGCNRLKMVMINDQGLFVHVVIPA